MAKTPVKNKVKETVKKTSSKVVSRVAKKKTRKVQSGVVNILATYSNTLITVADSQGNVLPGGQSSSGASGFSGTRKSTPFAAQIAAEKICNVIKESGMISLVIIIKGVGPGRDGALKAIVSLAAKDKDSNKEPELKITEIRDETGIPHNGPRAPKERRV